MKNLSIAVLVTALIAFPLGYFVREPAEPSSNISEDPDELTVREHTESPATRAQTIVGSDQNDAGAPFILSSHQEVVITNERSSSRERFKKKRLGEFFLINGIGSDREEQIIQALVQADLYIALKRKAMIDRHVAELAEPITQEDIDKIVLTAEEKAELYAERESLYRRVFDEYFEAYEEYNRTYPQRQLVGVYSSSLKEPLEHAAKESLVQIMYEETSRLESELSSESAGSGAQLASSPQAWKAEKEKHTERLLGMRSYNERVLDRTETYLTPTQFDQLKRRLDGDVRRFELLIELTDIDETR